MVVRPKRSIRMDEFSYLSVLLSVILGLAVTQILKGFRGMVMSRARIRLYWPTLLWAALVLLMCVQSWWAMFGLRLRQGWKFQEFGVVLFQTILTYMLAGLVLPDLFGDEPVDLKKNFFDHRRWFFWIGFLLIAVSVSKDLILTGGWPSPANLAFHAIFGALLLVGALTPNERYHKVNAILGFALFVAYILLLFTRIGRGR